MDSLNIFTGAKRIPVTRDGVQAGELVFNPADVVFAEKFYKLIGEFESRFAEYQTQARALEADAAQDANGLPKNLGEQIALSRQACEFAYEQIDALFGPGSSAMVFGETYVPDAILQFFDGVAPYVRQARSEKMQKYIGANGHKQKPKRKK